MVSCVKLHGKPIDKSVWSCNAMPLISWGLAALQACRYTTFSYIVIDLHTMVAEVANAYDAILTYILSHPHGGNYDLWAAHTSNSQHVNMEATNGTSSKIAPLTAAVHMPTGISNLNTTNGC